MHLQIVHGMVSLLDAFVERIARYKAHLLHAGLQAAEVTQVRSQRLVQAIRLFRGYVSAVHAAPPLTFYGDLFGRIVPRLPSLGLPCIALRSPSDRGMILV